MGKGHSEDCCQKMLNAYIKNHLLTMWKFSVSNISSPETTDGGVLSLASSSNHHWPLQPPERCGFLLFSFYSLPVIMTKAFREDVMLEIHSLLRMAVSTPRYSSRCGVPHAVLVFLASVTRRRVSPSMPTKAPFPASKYWIPVFTLFTISVLTFHFLQLRLICTHTYSSYPM